MRGDADTSKEAFAQGEASGRSATVRQEIWDLLRANEPMTRSETDRLLKHGAYKSHVSARLAELKEMGSIVRVGRRICRASGHSAGVWKATDIPPKPKYTRKKSAQKEQILFLSAKLKEVLPLIREKEIMSESWCDTVEHHLDLHEE